MQKLKSGSYVGLSTVVDNDGNNNSADGVYNLADVTYWSRLQEWPYKQATIKATVSGAGNVTAQPGGGFIYHSFTGPGTLTVTETIANLEILAVAGGGGNNTEIAGGGGAGGLLYGTLTSVPSPVAFTVTIGGGGGSQTNGANTTVASPAGTYTAVGGGRGGGYSFHLGAPVRYGNPGGSGGGQGGAWPGFPNAVTATGTQSPSTTPYGTLTGFGNPGGIGSPGASLMASGGGGADAAGEAYNARPGGGNGGNGKQYPLFTGPLVGVAPLAPFSGYYAGGGGGASYPTAITPGIGGLGGGGKAYVSPGVEAIAGVGAGGTNTGGGSGGGPYNGYSPFTPGGSGVVIFRYPSA